ncbi:Uncharacterised protein [Mycobacteroides abscessus subsp. abscessus]|nr:Uncharacterised protein [Mycobacteroides abscessus subsp. abscessus]
MVPLMYGRVSLSTDSSDEAVEASGGSAPATTSRCCANPEMSCCS